MVQAFRNGVVIVRTQEPMHTGSKITKPIQSEAKLIKQPIDLPYECCCEHEGSIFSREEYMAAAAKTMRGRG
jgi:hypothetical protein